MTNYALATLLKVKQHNKQCAELTLKQAAHNQELAEVKLQNIQSMIIQKKNSRAKIADSFFHKAKNSPCKKPELLCLIYSSQKNINDENSLRNALEEQAKNLCQAKLSKKQALQSLLSAHIDLKIIDNHFVAWQQKIKRTEDLSLEYEVDDQNGSRFCLKKRA